MNIIGKKWYYLSVSLFLVAVSIASIFFYGFKEGVDFSGGTLWQFDIPENSPNTEELQNFMKDKIFPGDVRINRGISGEFLIRFVAVSESDHQKYLTALTERYQSFKELSFSSIGPSIGAELRKKSFIAIVLVLLGISFYIAYAFRKASRPVSSWKYGWITLITLFHDVIIPAGLIAFLGRGGGVEVDGNFVVALLVVMGFSVHDTIVVFDRIRENVLLRGNKEQFEHIVNDSVNQTLARSINTSLTLILVLIALYFAGPETLKYFILTLLVGVTVGIYSSIFIASPLLVLFKGKKRAG